MRHTVSDLLPMRRGWVIAWSCRLSVNRVPALHRPPDRRRPGHYERDRRTHGDLEGLRTGRPRYLTSWMSTQWDAVSSDRTTPGVSWDELVTMTPPVIWQTLPVVPWKIHKL